jgi:hypothetical protein
MRHVSEPIAQALRQGVAKLCHVWLLTRRDGEVLGFTDHDRALTFLGAECQAASGLTQGAADAGMSDASSAALSGVITSDALAAADIIAGLYDEASIASYVVDWTDPSQYVQTGAGTLARLELRGGAHDGEGAFVAHVDGLLGKLDRVIGRRFTHLCDAVLGDARCGFDVGTLPGMTCDKRYRTCLETFHNNENFRGFPDLPGEDFLTLYPRSGDVLDGGGRGQGSGR